MASSSTICNASREYQPHSYNPNNTNVMESRLNSTMSNNRSNALATSNLNHYRRHYRRHKPGAKNRTKLTSRKRTRDHVPLGARCHNMMPAVSKPPAKAASGSHHAMLISRRNPHQDSEVRLHANGAVNGIFSQRFNF